VGFTSSLQSEWQYLSRAVPGVEVHLGPVEEAIRDVFIPALLECSAEDVRGNSDFRQLLSHGCKQGGLNIRNPVASAPRMRQSSVEGGKVLVKSLREAGDLDLVEHQQCAKGAGLRAKKERVELEIAFVDAMKRRVGKKEAKRLERIGETGAWLTAAPNVRKGTALSADEWRDNARLRYGLRPHKLQDRCDGCGKGFSVDHGINCKVGGLPIVRHNNLAGTAGALAAMALTKSCVSYEPNIFYGAGVLAGQGIADLEKIGHESRGDVAVHGLWKRGETCILDIVVTDTDAKAHEQSTSRNAIEGAARKKKKKYLDACLARRKTFMPLSYSVDGMAGKEARAFEKRIAALLAEKWGRAYSEMCGWVRSMMAISIARSNTLLLRGPRQRRSRWAQFEDGAALESMHCGNW
jgi:hypothetical protein